LTYDKSTDTEYLGAILDEICGSGPQGEGCNPARGLVLPPPYKSRHGLAALSPRGYISPRADLHLHKLSLGKHVFLGDGVTIFGRGAEESAVIGDEVAINKDTIIELGHGGSLVIGARTTIQPRYQLSAYKGATQIGEDVQIAPACAFYPYNHGLSSDVRVRGLPQVRLPRIRLSACTLRVLPRRTSGRVQLISAAGDYEEYWIAS